MSRLSPLSNGDWKMKASDQERVSRSDPMIPFWEQLRIEEIALIFQEYDVCHPPSKPPSSRIANTEVCRSLRHSAAAARAARRLLMAA
jgi:hypothetical protein